MGFYQTHNGWTYIQHRLLTTSDHRFIAKYTNGSGSSKKVTSVTFDKMGVAIGTVQKDPGGDYLDCTGEATSVRLKISGKNSNSKTISNKCGPTYYYNEDGRKCTYYSYNNTKSFTFTFSDAPVVSNGDTVRIELIIESEPNATDRGLVIVRDKKSSGKYISGTTANPYTAFSDISYNDLSPKIGRYNDTTFTANYSITGGTNGLSYVRARLFDMGGNNLNNYGFGTSKGNNLTGSFRVDRGGTGWHYGVSIQASDGTTTKESGRKDIYTYVMPSVTNLRIVANNIPNGSNKFSPQDLGKAVYSTNGRKWTFSGGESNFTTKSTINGIEANASSQEPTNNTNERDISKDGIEEPLSDTVLNNKFNANQRSVSQMNGSIKIERINTSANSSNYKSSQTVNFIVQYQPVNMPAGGGVSDLDGNNVKGKTVFVQEVEYINLDWTYNKNSGAAGVVDGYKIQVFKDSNCTQQVGDTYYQGDNSKRFNTKTQLQRGIMNYVKITPYYYMPNKTGAVEDDSKIILGTQSYIGQLVKPVSKFMPPQIDYPINDTIWHNKYFRVLLQLPVDGDLDELCRDGTISSENDYRYKNIQIRVTPNGKNSVTYSITVPAEEIIYSKSLNNITHKSTSRRIAICPALYSLDNDTTGYKIEVRAQKKYYNLTEEESWSDWAVVTVRKEEVSKIDLVPGDYIRQTHYAIIRNSSVSSFKVYPIVGDGLNRNVNRQIGDEIRYEDFAGIYYTLTSIQNGVNGYCTYDNIAVSFTRQLIDLTQNPPKSEYITAANKSQYISGRNYINILIDDLNLLW